MTRPVIHTAADALREAALLVAAGNPAVLAAHVPDDTGRCAGCSTPRPPWPCSLAVIARDARAAAVELLPVVPPQRRGGRR